MNRRICALSLTTLLAFTLLSGCQNSKPLVNDPTVPLAYLKDSSSDNLANLAKSYNSAINANRRDKYSHPGLFCDYAVALALQGNHQEANKWFNNEVAAFPKSRPYVLQLKLKLIPKLVDDTSHAEAPAPIVNFSIPADTAVSNADHSIRTVIDEAAAADSVKSAKTMKKNSKGSQASKSKQKKSSKSKRR